MKRDANTKGGGSFRAEIEYRSEGGAIVKRVIITGNDMNELLQNIRKEFGRIEPPPMLEKG